MPGWSALAEFPARWAARRCRTSGAYGQEVSETIREVQVLDLRSLEFQTLANADCQFAYRTSVFNTTERERYIILRVSFAVRQGEKPSLRYADLQKFFADHPGEPTLSQVRAAVREIRHRKAMLIVPGDEDASSAGSFFKNPVVPETVFVALSAKLEPRGLQLPSYPASEGFRKLPAAWLVEHAGFEKGYVKGSVGISRKHALAIINRGGATAADIIALKDEIQARVKDEFGIELQPEPVFVGF